MSGNCVPGTEGPKDTVITTREEQAALVKRARADALREAAETARHGIANYDIRKDLTVTVIREAVAAAIETLIDQPQEDVCEWEVLQSDYITTQCGCVVKDEQGYKYCPYCSKTIKVKK